MSGTAVLRSGLNSGVLATSAPTWTYSWLIMNSRLTFVPALASSGRTRASAMWRCSTGEYMKLVA